MIRALTVELDSAVDASRCGRGLVGPAPCATTNPCKRWRKTTCGHGNWATPSRSPRVGEHRAVSAAVSTKGLPRNITVEIEAVAEIE